MKRFLYYFATMLLVLMTTNIYMGGALFRFAAVDPTHEISAQVKFTDDVNANLGSETDMLAQEKDLDTLINAKSREFVRLAFERDRGKIRKMLLKNTEYIVAENNSSYVRFTSDEIHVEGYMATDKKLISVTPKWHVKEADGTVTSGVEVEIEGEKAPQVWYIHYRKSFGQWKIYMLENGV